MSQYVALTLLARSTVQEGSYGNLPHQVIIKKIKLKINISSSITISGMKLGADCLPSRVVTLKCSWFVFPGAAALFSCGMSHS